MILNAVKKALPSSAKKIIKRIISPYRQFQYVRLTKRLIARTNHDRPAEIAIFIMIAENWNSFETLYRTIQQDDRLNITVYVFPGKVFTDKPQELNLKLYGEVLEFFRARGIDVVKAYDNKTGKYIAPESVKADYVFYDEPYEFYPEGFKIRDMYKRAKVCYIPYGVEITSGEAITRIAISESVFCFIYAYFAGGEARADYAERIYDRIGRKYHHVFRLGSPRFDLLKKLQELPKQGGGYFSILWNPRFTLSDDNSGDPSSATTFFTFREKINERASSHEDEYWIIRPHPRAFSQYINKGAMTPEEVEQYKLSLKENPRTELDKNKDYLDAFTRSDIMLADFSGIIAEFLALGKPIIYCGNPEAVGLPGMLECMYKASSWEEAESLIDRLKKGIDPLAEKRKNFARELVSDGRCAEKIADFLANDFKNAGR